MGHRMGTQSLKPGGFLRSSLLLVSIFAAAGEPQGACPPDAGFKTGLTHLTNELKVGSTAKFLCPSGEYPWPVSSRTCQANGQWSSMRSNSGRKISSVSCKKIRCPEPLVFENGAFYPRGPYLVGSNITFTCNDGYIPRGSMERTCKRNGKWSGETAICDDGAGHCSDPGVPPGAVKTGVRYDVDERVTYKCVSGLTLIGSSSRTCLESRRWSGTEVSCQYPYSFDLPEEVGEYFAGSLSGLLKTHGPKGVGRTVKIQKDGILNVYILLDASESVGEDKFEISKDCTKSLVEQLGKFDMKIQYGIFSYASAPRQVMSITDVESEFADAVLEKIEENLKYSFHKEKSGTNIYEALRAVYEMMSLQETKFKDKAQWNSVHHVIILMTDGKSNMGGRPVDMIKKIKGFLNITQSRIDYLDIYAFGIGDGVDKAELSEIASQKEKERHMFTLKTADDMKEVFGKIIEIKNYGDMCGLNEESSDSKDSYPWNVLMAVKTSNCFASLISSSWVLTAAHCIKEEPKDYHLKIGGDNYIGERVVIHDCYNLRRKKDIGVKEDYDYDVALIKLDRKVKFSQSARPICIPCTEPANRAMKKGSGATCDEHRQNLFSSNEIPAGFLSNIGKKNDIEIKENSVNIKMNNARDTCTLAINRLDKFKNISINDMVSPRHLCVEGDMSCKGESGGSLFVDLRQRQRFFQVGILSFGIHNPCPNQNSAVRKNNLNARDFYVNVFEVLPFLRKHLAEELPFLPGIPDHDTVVCPT